MIKQGKVVGAKTFAHIKYSQGNHCPKINLYQHSNQHQPKEASLFRYVVWVLIDKFRIPRSNLVLIQVSLTKSELGFIFNCKDQESRANCSRSISLKLFLLNPKRRKFFRQKLRQLGVDQPLYLAILHCILHCTLYILYGIICKFINLKNTNINKDQPW